jgi:hypothetical protein
MRHTLSDLPLSVVSMLAPPIQRYGEHLVELPERKLNDDAEVVAVTWIVH